MRFKLEEMAELQKGFAFKSKDFKKSGIKIIKVSNLTDNSIDDSECVFIDNELAHNYKKYELNSDDIIITTVGSWPTNPASVVGKVVRVPKQLQGSLLNQNAVRIRGNQNVDQRYLFYLLKSKFFKDYIIGTAQGSANQASITINDIKNFKYDVHELEEQKAIAKILSDLDEKIEINNRINKVLEQIAQAIFKRWFVDFEFPNENGEPYKSSGGEMVDSELGPIPKGWEVGKLGEYISFIKGKKPKFIDENKNEGYMDYLTIDVLNNNSRLFANPEKMILVECKNNMMVMDGASSGTIYFGHKGIVASTLAKIEVINNKINDDILYFILKYYEGDIKNHTTGSAIPHADKEYIKRLPVVLPNDYKILQQFSGLSENIRRQIFMLIKKNQTLSQLRDTLLPKLMSGEIRVDLNNGKIVMKNNEN